MMRVQKERGDVGMRKTIGEMLGKTLLGLMMLFGLMIALNITLQGILRKVDLVEITTPIGMGLTALFLYLLFERSKGWKMGWRDRHAGSHMFTGIIMISIVLAVTMSMMLLNGEVSLGEQPWSWKALMMSSILFLLVAIGEEWLFRGYFFGLYKERLGVKAAIILNSCLFTVIHLGNPNSISRPMEHIAIEMVNIFLIAVLMSMARAYTGSLWMPIGIHFCMNFLQSGIFGFLNGGKKVESLFHIIYENKNIWNGAGHGLESSLIFTSVLILSTFLMGILCQKNVSNQNTRLNEKEVE